MYDTTVEPPYVGVAPRWCDVTNVEPKMQRRSIFPGRSLRIKPAVISESAGFSVQLTTLILGWRDTTPVWPGGITPGLPRG
jgi:hypothetical protein